jgi:hypothetical protein
LVPSCGLPRYAAPTPFWRQNYAPAETDAGTRRDRAPSGRLDDSEAEILRGATDALRRPSASIIRHNSPNMFNAD